MTDSAKRRKQDAASLYDKLENCVMPAYYDHGSYINMMAHTIALNGSFFNTQRRMMQQSISKAYFL